MTIKQVEEKIEEIREVAWDYEVAHGKEDDLYVAVLEAIANGPASRARGLARAALKAQLIQFPRHAA